MSELVPSGQGGSAVEAVVNELAGARLVTTSRNESGQEVVDVAHEALIRGWPRLQRWVDENPAALRIHRDLTVAAEAWNANKRERRTSTAGPAPGRSGRVCRAQPRQHRRPHGADLPHRQSQGTAGPDAPTVGGLAAASLVFAVLGVAALLSGGTSETFCCPSDDEHSSLRQHRARAGVTCPRATARGRGTRAGPGTRDGSHAAQRQRRRLSPRVGTFAFRVRLTRPRRNRRAGS